MIKLFGLFPLCKVPVKLKAGSYFGGNLKMAADAWNCNVLWPTIKPKKVVLGIPEEVPITEVSWSWTPVAARHLFRKGLSVNTHPHKGSSKKQWHLTLLTFDIVDIWHCWHLTFKFTVTARIRADTVGMYMCIFKRMVGSLMEMPSRFPREFFISLYMYTTQIIQPITELKPTIVGFLLVENGWKATTYFCDAN